MSDLNAPGLILLKCKHLVSHLAATGRGQRDLDDVVAMVAKLRLDLEPIEKVKALSMPQLLSRLRAANLFRG